MSALLLIGAAGPAYCAKKSAPQEIEAKVALEASLERRAMTVLQKVLGTDDIVVMVNVEVHSASDPNDQEILPGVPLKDSMVAPLQGSLALTMVKSMSVMIILDQTVPKEDLQLVRTTVAGILGMDESRGDKLTIQQMQLSKEAKAMGAKAASASSRMITSYKEFVQKPSKILQILWLVLALFAVILFHTRFLRPLLSTVRNVLMAQLEANAQAKKPATPAESAQAEMEALGGAAPAELPSSSPESDGKAREGLPFAFLEERHIPMLKFLVKSQDTRITAVVIHYMRPKLAALLLTQMEPELRREVVGHMSKVVQLKEEDVRSVEYEVKNRIEFMMGGEDKLAEILDQCPAGIQQEMLETLQQQDAGLGARLGRRIVLLDDIGLLEASDLKLLTQRAPVRSLAVVLKSAEEVKGRLLPKLSGGIAAWLSQEIELTKPPTPEVLAAEQQRVLRALSQLIREGRIKLNKEGAGLSEEAAAEAQATAEELDLPVSKRAPQQWAQGPQMPPPGYPPPQYFYPPPGWAPQAAQPKAQQAAPQQPQPAAAPEPQEAAPPEPPEAAPPEPQEPVPPAPPVPPEPPQPGIYAPGSEGSLTGERGYGEPPTPSDVLGSLADEESYADDRPREGNGHSLDADSPTDTIDTGLDLDFTQFSDARQPPLPPEPPDDLGPPAPPIGGDIL